MVSGIRYEKEQILDLYPSYAAYRECIALGIDKSTIKIRLMRIELSSSEIEVLATTLTDPKVMPYDLFARLYHQRWFVEEDYKCPKLPLEIENFIGKTVHSVYQDCYAQILAKNITSILSFDARARIKRDHKKQ